MRGNGCVRSFLEVGADSRSQAVRDTWKTPLKHDIVGLVARGVDGVVALGMDHEMAAHEWGDKPVSSSSEPEAAALGRLHHNHKVFRSRARWMGCAVLGEKCVGRDIEGTWYAVGF